MKLLVTVALLLAATTVHATDPTLFTMNDAQFKSYATHEAGIATRKMSITADQLDQYRDKCSSGDSKACMTGLALGRMSASGDMKYFDLYGAAKDRNGGKLPKWFEKLDAEHSAAMKKLTASLQGMVAASKSSH